MIPTVEPVRTEPLASSPLRWTHVAWFGLLAIACYAPVLSSLVRQWVLDPDMGHGFFVPLIAGFIVWQQRHELAALKLQPNWWGLAVVLWGGAQVMVGTLGVELFVARTGWVVLVIGMVWLLGGNVLLRKMAFPLFLLFFMVPIPTIVYTPITFRLQIWASILAEQALTVLGVPVMREGNILNLPNQQLSVVEACSGIRSLLTLTFLSLVFGYFLEKRTWLRVVLFLSTIPIAILANGGRITMTGVLTQVKPELAQGFFHESTGLVTFFAAVVILWIFHQVMVRIAKWWEARGKSHAVTE